MALGRRPSRSERTHLQTAREDDRRSPTLKIAVATYLRPSLLALSLPLLIAQADTVDVPVRILVVDNDPAGSAERVIRTHSSGPVDYVVESVPGIAAARNRAIAESLDARLLAFIDDDEVPEPGWLASLLACWRKFGCAAVAGPVRSQFEVPPSRWVSDSGMFTHIDRPTGAKLTGAATNNLLLDLDELRASHIRFDDRFGLSGGSDTMLSHQMIRHGLQLRWCAEAVVIESVPPPRATREWVLRRTIRTSNGWSRVALALCPSTVGRARERLELTTRAIVRAIRGAATLLRAALAHNPATRATAECALVSSYGMLLGAWGLTRSEYERDLSSPLRILVAQSSADGGQSGPRLVELVSALTAEGYQVIAVVNDAGPLTKAIADRGATVMRLRFSVLRMSLLHPSPTFRSLVAAPVSVILLWRLIRRERVSALYVDIMTAPTWLAAAKLAGIPSLRYVDHADDTRPRFVRRGITFRRSERP